MTCLQNDKVHISKKKNLWGATKAVLRENFVTHTSEN